MLFSSSLSAGTARIYSTGMAGVRSFSTASDRTPAEVSHRAPVGDTEKIRADHKTTYSTSAFTESYQGLLDNLTFSLTIDIEPMNICSFSRWVAIVILCLFSHIHGQSHLVKWPLVLTGYALHDCWNIKGMTGTLCMCMCRHVFQFMMTKCPIMIGF